MRFTIALTVQGQSLCDARLRQAIIELLLARPVEVENLEAQWSL